MEAELRKTGINHGLFYTYWLKKNVYWNRLPLSVFILFKITFFNVIVESSLLLKQSKLASFWQILVHFHFRVVYYDNLSKTGQQNGVTWKDMIDRLTFWVREPVTGNFLNITFLNKCLTESCCGIPKSVNQISHHGFKCFSGSVISSDKSECVAKFRFNLMW